MDREKVIKCLEACTGVTDDCAGHTCPYWDFDDSAVDWGCRIQMEKDALELLKEQEARIEQLNRFVNGFSRDAVPVVRCKDCKNLGYTNSHWFCKWLNRCVDEDWFCADGERKD